MQGATSPTTARDLGALQRFLEGCRQAAMRDQHWKLANITLAVNHIDPLAVIDSIYEAKEKHFYLETTARDEAVAGADAVICCESSGPERFAAIKAFANEVGEHTIATGDLPDPRDGVSILAAFAFADTVEAGSAMPAAVAFVPRWQVKRQNDHYTASANLLITADTPVEAYAQRLWKAHEKFSDFSYTAQPQTLRTQPDPVRIESSADAYAEAVRQALALIDAGAFRKLVLARTFILEKETDFLPLEALNRLRNRYPACHCFSFGNGDAVSFIGASPEWLLRLSDGVVHTEAIAGSIARGKTATEDANFARALLGSEKDIHEHRLVIDSIIRRLGKAGLNGQPSATPQLLQLANVQHLRTMIAAPVAEGMHILDIAAHLHPTPAVGGTPREAALPYISKLEPFSRGLYSGLVGHFNLKGEGQFAVAIRSALIEANRATVYAGAGIVAGSIPEKEVLETECKARAMMDVLANPA
ncbi:MAG: isochorismate synthase [Verrucomicrobiota bacterium]|nr:isochorismate synthase [Verrucomicrobiota bacterium]